MARDKSNSGIAGFDKVASDNNINSNKDIEKENDSDLSLEERLDRGEPSKPEKKFRGYYLDSELAEAIDIVAVDREKGYKSFLVNEILKDVFKQKGWL